MESDTQKSTKLHFQPGSNCVLKIDQPIRINNVNGRKCHQFKIKFKQTLTFSD